jgi:hypothetical protein
MVTATYTVELATADGANPSTFTDITSYVQSVAITRGRDDVLSQVQTGTARVTLINEDGRFSPGYTLSPLYGNVATMRAVRIRGTFSAVTYDLYYGYIQSITPVPTPNVRTCTLDLADGFAWLDLAVTTPTYTLVATGTSIGVALDSASWPAGLRDLATGQSTITPSYTDQSVLSQIQGIGIDNEAGLVYMSGAGKVVFQDRHTRLKTPYTVSQGTFTDTDALVDVAAERPVRDIANEVKVTHATGSVTATDATSQAAKGPRRLAINAGFLDASTAADRASWTLSTKKDEQDRPVIGIVGNASATLMTQVLARDLSDRVTITDAGARTGINAAFHIERIEHSISNGGTLHTVRWQLSPADASGFWALDVSLLDTSTRLAY